MQRIKRRTRADRLSTEQRGAGRKLGRWIYFALLAGLALWLLNFLFGDYVYLEAEGLVTRTTQRIASPNIATVEGLFVEEGDTVSAGEPLVQLRSQQVLEEIANLSTRVAEIEVRRERLRSRASEIESLMPIADKRSEALQRLRDRREQAIKRGLETERALHDLIEAEYGAVSESTRLSAEAKAIERERADLGRIAERLDTVLSRLESAYGAGLVESPIAGTIARLDVTAGAVLRPGESLMDIVHGESYILGYIESGALYSLEAGQPVLVRNGLSTFRGTVTDILPISAKLPQEFQRAFEPARRSQVIRVSMETDKPPPTYSRVEIVAANTWWRRLLRFLPW